MREKKDQLGQGHGIARKIFSFLPNTEFGRSFLQYIELIPIFKVSLEKRIFQSILFNLVKLWSQFKFYMLKFQLIRLHGFVHEIAMLKRCIYTGMQSA